MRIDDVQIVVSIICLRYIINVWYAC